MSNVKGSYKLAFRQGDVFVKLSKATKFKGKQTKSGNGERIVLAYGEVTGHAHAINQEGAILTETENRMFLQVLKKGGVDLEHEEHDPFLMAVAVGASCAFLTPIGHQNNTLIMGPAGYKFGDYWRMGLPLEILIVVLSVPMILVVWPL